MIFFNIVENEPVLKIEVTLTKHYKMKTYFFLIGVVMHLRGGFDEFNDSSGDIKFIIYLAPVNLIQFKEIVSDKHVVWR